MSDYRDLQEQGYAVFANIDWTEQVDLTFGDNYDEATKAQLVSWLERHVGVLW